MEKKQVVKNSVRFTQQEVAAALSTFYNVYISEKAYMAALSSFPPDVLI